MKRLHINLRVSNIKQSVNFYNALFNAEPEVIKEDYAKWSLDNPSVNFTIQYASENLGVNHLGIEAGSEAELKEVYSNIGKADGAVVREEGHTVCCYHQSEKSWVKDPQGVEWEAFHTYGVSEEFKGEATATDCCDDTCCTPAAEVKEEACCTPVASKETIEA